MKNLRINHRSLKDRLYIILLSALFILLLCTGCGASEASTATPELLGTKEGATLGDIAELELSSDDDSTYHFRYGNTTFTAVYRPDNWKIIDSFRISNHDDMVMICQALTERHPIRNAKGSQNRTPEAMAFEWEQHNLAYTLLPENSSWKARAKDVDLNPEDQGKSILQFLLDSAGH